jgi:putative aldouronate transport system permease protein
MIRDRSVSSRVLDLIVHASLAFVLVVTLFPVLHIASVSLSSGTAVARNSITFYPQGIQLNAYKLVLETARIPRSFANAVLYTIVGTAINMAMTILMAYPLSKKRLALRRSYTTLVVITMFFGGGLIPTFLLVRALGMYNTIWALVVPGAITTWNLIIMRTFFQALPVELEESAYLDGAGDFTILVRVALPLSGAAIATMTLFYLVSHWNSWFGAMIFLKEKDRYPLQLVLREIVLQGQFIEEMVQKGLMASADRMSSVGLNEYLSIQKLKYATLFASMVPMLLVYPFIQKYFVKGVMIGSLKG